MRLSTITAAALLALAPGALAQTTQPAPTSQPTSAPTSPPGARASEALVPTVPPAAWLTARVTEARERLGATEAGQVLWAALEAHGGLERWLGHGAIEFRFRYAPLGDRPANDTVEVVDLWSSRARHRVTDDPEVSFGWSGEQAWVRVPAGREPPTNVRFWSLTPYYFVAIPFVLADPGTQLALDGIEELEGRTYTRVRATFEPGTGDAPDDYYVVLVDQETHRVGGLRYIVSYPGFFPEGGHSPEKLMTYDGAQTTDGIVLPESYRTFALDEAGEPAEQVTLSTLSDVAFVSELPAGYFEPPEGAVVVEGF